MAENDKIVAHLFEGEHVVSASSIDAGKIPSGWLKADSVEAKHHAVGKIPAWKLNYHPGGIVNGPRLGEEGSNG
jgi:hypothetical protein